MKEEKTYTLFWLTGKSELVKGSDPSIAMTMAGYGAGALRALDFYAEGDQRNEYEWIDEERTWRMKKTANKYRDILTPPQNGCDDSILNPLNPISPISPLNPLNMQMMDTDSHVHSASHQDNSHTTPDPSPSHSNDSYSTPDSTSGSFDSGSSSDSGSCGGGD